MRILSAVHQRLWQIAWAALCLLGGTMPAHALPSYARQTGEPCTSCHVGAFGPQLTPHGRAFKIGGYSDSKDSAFRAPLSAMLVATEWSV